LPAASFRFIPGSRRTSSSSTFEPSPFPGTYRGHDGLRRWTQDLFSDLRNARLDVLEVIEDGDLMAVRMKLTAIGRASGIEGSFEWGSLVSVRDGDCVRAASDVTFERTLERFEEARASSSD
jgi:ketosteroid isomerase-like protein